MRPHDITPAGRFAEQRDAAEARLWREMEAAGLYARDGWKIAEITREARNGTELVLRPLHMRLPAPEHLECVVWIDADDGNVSTSCRVDEPRGRKS